MEWFKDDVKGVGGRELVLAHYIPGSSMVACRTVYLHLSRIVARDGPVRRGQLIAFSGASSQGSETGVAAHLHFHVWSGIGAYDSHTAPIVHLVMQGSQEKEFRYYSSQNGGLDDVQVAGRSFLSDNFPGSAEGAFPRPTVVDYSLSLSQPYISSIALISDRIKSKSGVAVLVVIVPTYRPFSSLQKYSDRLFEVGGTGREGKNNGVLFVLATNESKATMTVGPGISNVLTPEVTRRIVDDYFGPTSNKNNINAAVQAAVLAIGEYLMQAGLTRPPSAVLGTYTIQRISQPLYATWWDPWIDSDDIKAGLKAGADGSLQETPRSLPSVLRMLPPGTTVSILAAFPNEGWECKVRTPEGVVGYMPCDAPKEVSENNAVYFLRGVYEWEGFASEPIMDAESFRKFLVKYPRTPFASRVLLNVGYGYWAALDMCTRSDVGVNTPQGDPACADLGSLRQRAESAFSEVIRDSATTDYAFWARLALRDLHLGRATYKDHPMFRSLRP